MMLPSMKDELEEVKIAIRKVSADNFPEEELQYYWDKADLLLDLMSMTVSVDDFFEITEAFSQNKSYEYYNLNDVYVHRIERQG